MSRLFASEVLTAWRAAMSPFRRAAGILLFCVGCLMFTGCGTGEPASDDDAATQAARDRGALRFSRVTGAVGLGGFRHVTAAFGEKWFPETMGGGAGFLDMDGDGWQDIVLVGGGTWPGRDQEPVPALGMYRNDRDGTFSDVTEKVGLRNLHAYAFGVAIADYDNDGDSDIFVTTLDRNVLLRNERGAGALPTFTEVTDAAGLGGGAAWSTSALFFDADLDRHVDLFVGNYVDWSSENDIWCTIDGKTKSYCTPQLYDGVAGRFYHNEGDGTFSDWTDRVGLGGGPGKTLGVAEWDFNRDGWPDFVVANDTQRDLLYLNDGEGTFTERGIASGLAFDEDGKARAGMGIDIGVIDRTGEPSVVVGHFSNEMLGMYRQISGGLFVDRAASAQVGRPSLPTLTFGLALFDADLDGDLDLFVANGHIAEEVEGVQEGISYRQRPQLFVNDGNGKFREHAPGVAAAMVARALAVADYDRDGDVDLLVTENGGPVHLLRNESVGGNALRVLLESRRGNRDAVGAHVTAVVGGTKGVRRVRTGSSYLAASEKPMTFGLGAETHVDTLVVRWPGGAVERYTYLPAGREVHVVEGVGVVDMRALTNDQMVAEYR